MLPSLAALNSVRVVELAMLLHVVVEVIALRPTTAALTETAERVCWLVKRALRTLASHGLQQERTGGREKPSWRMKQEPCATLFSIEWACRDECLYASAEAAARR